MVALLTSEQLNVLVLLDDEKEARTTRDELVRSKLIREQNVVFVSEGLDPKTSKEMDIEDLIDPTVYETLIRESYAKELKGKSITLNSKIPRIAKRFEAALNDIGIDFHKARPTRLFLKKMGTDSASVMTPNMIKRFESLFVVVNERLQKHIHRAGKAFE